MNAAHKFSALQFIVLERYLNTLTTFGMRTKLSVAILLLLVFTWCKQSKKRKLPAAGSPQSVQAPTTLVNVPFAEFTVKAETGDTLAYKGSIIFFPPNAFVDKTGKPITGKVQVKYRELNDPVDYYLGGVPMNYDSAGSRYTFQSVTMCELLAYQNGRPVFVNPASQPEISMLENRGGAGGSIYYFDSTLGNWVNKGQDERNLVLTILDISTKGMALNYRGSKMPTAPLRPRKADGRSPVIKLEIDPSSFEELQAYNNLQFEIDTTKQKFDPTDSDREWNTVKLEKGSADGLYLVKLANVDRSVQYFARPVLNEKDYDKALVTFNSKLAEYEKSRHHRERNQFVKDSIEFERMDRMSAMIEARNKKIREENVATEQINREIEAMNMSTSVLRTFKIDGFGVWNIDKLIFADAFPITAVFHDSAGNVLSLKNIAVIEKELNGIWRFPGNDIDLVRNADNMIIGTYNNQIAYLSFKEYKKYTVTPASTQVFVMKLVPENQHNYEQLKTRMLE